MDMYGLRFAKNESLYLGVYTEYIIYQYYSFESEYRDFSLIFKYIMAFITKVLYVNSLFCTIWFLWICFHFVIWKVWTNLIPNCNSTFQECKGYMKVL